MTKTKKWLYLQLFLLLQLPSSPITAYQKAFFTVPVADLVDSCMSIGDYLNQPVCGIPPFRYKATPRLHQGKYNEVVDLLELRGDWALIAIPQVYFITQNNPQPQHRYWTLAHNLTTFDDLAAHSMATHKIPQPISFKTGIILDGTVITLREPFYDATTRLTFSVGTRFVLADTHSIQGTYHVYAFNPATHTFVTIALPTSVCIRNTEKPLAQKIELFIELLRSFAHMRGTIPYVLGGCSITKPIKNFSFKTVTTTKDNCPISFYVINNDDQSPKTGLDCSNAISFAAHIVGLPYFFKNTVTLNETAGLQEKEHLAPGDLIVIKGHVMIVSDVEKNLLIEARGYDHGYGKLHEIELKKVFKDIATYQELEKAYQNNQPLTRLDSSGKPQDTFATFKLIKLGATLKSPMAA